MAGCNKFHKDLDGPDIHIIHQFTYADQATRDAATGLVPTDVGKVALQSDELTWWVLVDDSPVTWKEITNATADEDTYASEVGVAVNDLVYISGSNTVDQAKGDAASTSFAIGVVTAKPTAATATVKSNGKQGGFSGLTVGAPIFLSTSTAGGVQQTVPGSGTWLQVIGVATSATEIHLELKPPIKRT